MNGLDAYLASNNRSKMKFWLNIVTDDVFGISYTPTTNWKYLDAYCDHINTLMQDPQWLTFNGKWVIGVTGHTVDGPDMDATHWNTCKSHFTKPIYLIEMDGNVTIGTAIGANGLFTYGYQAASGGLGHQAWSYIGDKDATSFGASAPGFDHISALTPALDRRPTETAVSNDTYTDQPTQTEWYNHMVSGLTANSVAQAITFWNELAEEYTAHAPSVQEGTRYLDATRWARTHQRDASYTFEIDAHSFANTPIVGFATYVDPWAGNVAMHDGDEVQSSTTNDALSLTWGNTTQLGLYATKGPDRGIVEVDVDGSFVANVDLYAAAPAYHQLVWVSALSVASHTVKYVVTGTKNASSSGVLIGLDSTRVTYTP